MGNLLEKYYEAVKSGDTMAEYNLRKQIEERRNTASWNGCRPDYEEHYEMGS